MKEYLTIAVFLAVAIFAGSYASGKLNDPNKQILCENGSCSAHKPQRAKCGELYEYMNRCLTYGQARALSGVSCQLPGIVGASGTSGILVIIESRRTIECRTMM